MTEIEHEGLVFSIPSDVKKLPVKALEAWEEDRFLGFVKALIGKEAWTEFLSRDPDMEDFERLAIKIGESYGFDNPGKSSASRDSSGNTAGHSKPTSSMSTVSPLPPAIPQAR